MTLKSYIEKLQSISELYPKAILVYSSDSEGNSFRKVGYEPTTGNFEGRSFIPEGNFKDDGNEDLKINAVCVN